jgi:hypothetical protein
MHEYYTDRAFKSAFALTKRAVTGKAEASFAPVMGTTPEEERIHKTNFDAALEFSLEKNGPGIIAIGKGWMKGYKDPQGLHFDALNPMVTALINYCDRRNVPLIIADDDDLPGLIEKERSMRSLPADAKVIMLAGADKSGALSKAIEPLAGNSSYTILGINGEELTADSYIRLMEILTIAIKLSVGIKPSSDSGHMDILPPDEKRAFYIIIPHAEPMDYEMLKEIYEVQSFA